MSRMLLFMLLFGPFGFAQTTWKGLRFGMSEDEVRRTYGGSLHTDEQTAHEPKDYLLVADSDQELEGLSARVHFSFDKNTKVLGQIRLSIKDPFAGQDPSPELAGHSLAIIHMLTRDLTEKYGKPVTAAGECNPTAAMSIRSPALHCDAMWRYEGQIIKMSWFFVGGRLTGVFLSYAPPPKGI